MTNGQFMKILSTHMHRYAKECREDLQRNYHMHDLNAAEIAALTDEQIRAILNGFANNIAAHQCGMDYAMNTSDFKEAS